MKSKIIITMMLLLSAVGWARAQEELTVYDNAGTSNKIPRMTAANPNGNWVSSDLFIKNGSYLRLKNVTIGYDFTKLLQKIPHFAQRGSSCSVYFSAENPLTITKYSGMDPEVGGYDTLTYPVSKVFAFGVKINY